MVGAAHAEGRAAAVAVVASVAVAAAVGGRVAAVGQAAAVGIAGNDVSERRRAAPLRRLLFDQRLDEVPGGRGGPVPRALDAAEQATLAVDEVRRGRSPDSVNPAGDVAGAVDEHGGDVAAILRGFPYGVSALLEVHEHDFQALALELFVQPVDGR